VPDRLQPQYEFDIADSRIIRPVLADCSNAPDRVVPIVARIGESRYAISSDSEPLYVDLLMNASRTTKGP